jgi:hypothetical protein
MKTEKSPNNDNFVVRKEVESLPQKGVVHREPGHHLNLVPINAPRTRFGATLVIDVIRTKSR